MDIFEIKHRQERFGFNQLTPKKGKGSFIRFLQQLNNPLVIILMVAGLITAVLKDPVDSLVIFGVVLLNAVIGYIQEAKAEQAIAALADTMVTEPSVIRSGGMARIPATELVPGDIVLLQAGARVPADLRLVASRDLQVIEAALTGESLPVEKQADVLLEHDSVLAERRNMAYTSTLGSLGHPGTYLQIAEITSGMRTGDFVFTADTVANLPALYELAIAKSKAQGFSPYRYFTETPGGLTPPRWAALTYKLPAFSRWTVGSNTVLQFMSTLAMLVVAAGIPYLLGRFIRERSMRWFLKAATASILASSASGIVVDQIRLSASKAHSSSSCFSPSITAASPCARSSPANGWETGCRGSRRRRTRPSTPPSSRGAGPRGR